MNGFEIRSLPFWTNSEWKILYLNGHKIDKIINTIYAFFRRLWVFVHVRSADIVFIHREATPIGPPIFEWVIAKVFQKRIIYDFDDAIWLPNTSKENGLVSYLKFHGKTASICKMAFKVSCGNDFLLQYALPYNKSSFYNPSTIDLDYHTLNSTLKSSRTRLVIGWTGSHSTLKFINIIIPIISKLEGEYDFEFVVISNKDPEFQLKSIKFIKWNKEREIEDLSIIDIGIMPLYDDKWSEGKCGFKLLQYMSLGIPSLASPVGVNKAIIDHGDNGFLCKDELEWENNLRVLIENPKLRETFGIKAKAKVEKYYSVKANENNFLSLFS
jgi:glycosyltransferase involved in cell wall biosynthesis